MVRKEDACHVTYTKSTTSRGFVGTCVPMPRLRTLRNPSSTPRHVTYAKFNHVTWFCGYVRTHASRTDFAKSVTHTLPTPPLHPDDARSTRGPSSGTFANRSTTSYTSPPFAFASRASVSLHAQTYFSYPVRHCSRPNLHSSLISHIDSKAGW